MLNWSSNTFCQTIWCCWSYLLRYRFALIFFLNYALRSSICAICTSAKCASFYFIQDSPYVGAIIFHELPTLLTILLPPLLFMFLYWKADCLANRIFSSWIWLVRARILTSFSVFVSHCQYLTNDLYLTMMLRINLSGSMFVPSLYFSWNCLI